VRRLVSDHRIELRDGTARRVSGGHDLCKRAGGFLIEGQDLALKGFREHLLDGR
jgi:hypothetical protein